MASFKKNEEGVSAVIGVILMVAITVILAAVIAAFVFQLGNQLPQSSHSVGAQVTRADATTIQVKTMSGDVNMLYGGTATQPTYKVVFADGTIAPIYGSAYNANTTGMAIKFTVAQNTEITVIANYTDGTTSNVFAGKV